MGKLTKDEADACERYFDRFIDELRGKGFPFMKPARKYRPSTARRYFSIIEGYDWAYGHEFSKGKAEVVFCFFKEGPEKLDPRRDEAMQLLLAQKSMIQKIMGPMKWYSWYCCVTRSGAFSNDEKTLAEIRAWAVGQMFKLAEASMLQQIATELPPQK